MRILLISWIDDHYWHFVGGSGMLVVIVGAIIFAASEDDEAAVIVASGVLTAILLTVAAIIFAEIGPEFWRRLKRGPRGTKDEQRRYLATAEPATPPMSLNFNEEFPDMPRLSLPPIKINYRILIGEEELQALCLEAIAEGIREGRIRGPIEVDDPVKTYQEGR